MHIVDFLLVLTELFLLGAILDGKWTFCIFEPPSWDLWATYDDHLRLIGKHVVDFLFVLTELLSLRLYKLISVRNQRFRQLGPADPKFQVKGVAPTTILLLRKLD